MEIGISEIDTGQITKRFRNLLLATAIATLLLIIIGYVVRVTNSSLGCPDWPTCYGQYGLPAGINAQIQYLHRIVAFLATFLVLLASVIAVRSYRSKQFITIPLFSASVLILLEVISGSEVIKITLPQFLGLIHLAMALTILALLIYATVLAYFDQMGI